VRRLGRLGDFSYWLYIYAFPTQQLMIWLYKDRLPWGAVLALSIGATLALAFASWHLVEKHALRLKPRAPRQPASAKPAALA
jgi:peptidoglycan/LPS O-acetylase OafA/YrhL